MTVPRDKMWTKEDCFFCYDLMAQCSIAKSPKELWSLQCSNVKLLANWILGLHSKIDLAWAVKWLSRKFMASWIINIFKWPVLDNNTRTLTIELRRGLPYFKVVWSYPDLLTITLWLYYLVIIGSLTDVELKSIIWFDCTGHNPLLYY